MIDAQAAAKSPSDAGSATGPNALVLAARELLKTLAAQFAPFQSLSPLAIGIDKQLLAACPELDKKVLRQALRLHTSSTRYLRVMEKAAQRINLDGSVGAEVTDEMRQHAAGLLRERFKKQSEQKRAREAAEKADRQHQEKLQQLADKFGRKDR